MLVISFIAGAVYPLKLSLAMIFPVFPLAFIAWPIQKLGNAVTLRCIIVVTDFSLILSSIFIHDLSLGLGVVVEHYAIRVWLILEIIDSGCTCNKLWFIVEKTLERVKMWCACHFSVPLNFSIPELTLIYKLISQRLVNSFTWRNTIKISIVDVLIYLILYPSSLGIALGVPFA